jgi:transposase
MEKERLSMRKIREILRLYHELGLGKKPIARACSVSSSTVVDYVRRVAEAGLDWPLPDDLDEASLEPLLFPTARHQRTSDRPFPPMEEIHRELCKKGVTLQLLWMEYKEKYPEG